MADLSQPPATSAELLLPAPLPLDGGQALDGVRIAYETCGTLNADRSNAVLLFHALTMDQHVVSTHPRTGKPGWWRSTVGPGKPIDTDRWFVICANVLGGCMGSTGPASLAADGQPYAMRFPVITIRDMVRAQVALLEALEIERLHAAVGGSMGGMQALSLAANWPQLAEAVLVIASSARHSAQNIAFHEVGRQAIMADPKWNGGDYYAAGKGPEAGLAVARMAAHITYLSEEGMHDKFGRKLQDRASLSYDFNGDFAVESYLRHQGAKFVARFDANSLLYITKAADYFDLERGDGSLLVNEDLAQIRFLVLSFTSDWLYPTYQSRAIVSALKKNGSDVSFCEIDTRWGHDAFLMPSEQMDKLIAGFLDRISHECEQ